MKPTADRDGRGSVRPLIVDQLKQVNLPKAAAEWYSTSRLPEAPLSPTEASIMWLIGFHDLTQASAAELLGLSIQRVSFLFARAVRKLREAAR